MQFNKTILKNGLRVITIPMNDNPSVTVLVMVAAGSKYETKAENGISHFLEHMVFKGTPRRPKAADISREFDSIGAQHNAFTSQEYTGYYAKVDSRHVSLALDIVADLYNNPLLDAVEMEKEKGVIVEEIRMYEDMPQAKVARIFFELVYGDQPAGWDIAGTEGNVRSFTRDEVVAYRSVHYVAEATTVVVSGHFDEKKVLADIEKSFAGISSDKGKRKAAVKEEQDGPHVKIGLKETDQSHLIIGVRSFPLDSPFRPALSVLAAILGKGMSSRLFDKLRNEMGICYYVGADSDLYTDHGLFYVDAGVDNSRVDEAIKVILSELAKTTKEKVTDAELIKIKDFIAGNIMLSLETSDELANYAGGREVLEGKVKTPEETIAKLRAVTAEQVLEVAQKIFMDKNLNLAIVGNYKDEERFRKLLTFQA
ncbi:MAG: pitrilysin family protein [Candidatus Pacebacteria bacterium]|nr:pitrilysin family protein [Candidatus Paceibacterota bacterium]